MHLCGVVEEVSSLCLYYYHLLEYNPFILFVIQQHLIPTKSCMLDSEEDHQDDEQTNEQHTSCEVELNTFH